MKVTILCVGKVKEAFYRDAIAEYAKRLSKYVRLEIVEVADEKTPDKLSEVQREQILQKEAERLLAKLDRDSYVITLEIKGKSYGSETFAQMLEKAFVQGGSHVTFVIGGSLGLHESICRERNLSLSFSEMTFPHQLMRVILLEQIYRAQRILSNEPYHK